MSILKNSRPRTLAVLTALCALGGGAGYLCSRSPEYAAASLGWYMLAYACGGYATLRAFWKSLRAGQLDVNLLMLLAAAGAAAIGDWVEGAVLLFLFSLSNALETYTLERTARSIEALIQLRPETALVLRQGREQRVPVEAVGAGELVRIIPAERFAVDGIIIEGSTTVDQAAITGESMPADKREGESVFAGTLNLSGSVVVEAQCAAGETALAKIVRTVREAQDEKSGVERTVARWQKVYVIGVLGGAALMALLHVLYPEADVPRDQLWSSALYHAMVMLVAVSPCAVVITAPAATLAALTRAARKGVLFKGGVCLERLADVRVMAFDKTGTLTIGKPEVVRTWVNTGGDGEARFLQLTASLEHLSEHPLAQAVVRQAHARGIEPLACRNFESHTGSGVHGEVDGVWVGVGKAELFESHGIEIPPEVAAKSAEVRETGQTALLAVTFRCQTEGREEEPALEPQLCGVIAVADTLRPEAPEAFRHLRELGIERLVVLTGDHAAVGLAVARGVQASDVSAGLLPDGKVAELSRLRRTFWSVAMVGDGINDAPGLAAADVGVAMGGAGTDVTLDTADVVLMEDNLEALVFAVWLSQRTRRTIARGLIFSFGVIGLLVISAVSNILPLWLAVVFHEGSTLIAVLNGLLLLTERFPSDWPHPPGVRPAARPETGAKRPVRISRQSGAVER